MKMAIRAQKRTQHCSFCKNHGVDIAKKGHHCPHLNCTCPLCKLTKKSQLAMRHQQRVWRHQKQKLKSQKFDNEDALAAGEKANKSQACDKCRNHNILKLKRNHQCPFQNCQCEYCSLTFKRREIMKHQQRVRRSKITSPNQVESDGAPSAGEEPDEEDPDYPYFQEENLSNEPMPRANSLDAINIAQPYEGIGEENSSRGRNNEPSDNIMFQESVNDGLRNNSLPGSPPQNNDHVSYQNNNHPPPPSQHSMVGAVSNVQDEATPKSPPPLIHMAYEQISDSVPDPVFVRKTGSISPPIQSLHNHLDPSPIREHSPRTEEGPLVRFDSSYEDCKEDLRHSPLSFFPRANSSTSSPSFRSFPFHPSQPLERLSALNASLDPQMNSLKFGARFEDLTLRNCNFLPSTIIGNSINNIHPPASSILGPPYPRQQPERIQAHHPVRPLPLNISHHPTHQNSFSQNLWNHMLLPFNFGIQHNQTETASLVRFQGIVASSRFSARDIFHPA